VSEENSAAAKFDHYAENYSELHSANVSASGESTDYFAQHKLDCLERLGITPETPILDYGCGIGNLTCRLVQRFDVVHGYDPSVESLRVAGQRAPGASFSNDPEAVADGRFGAAVMAGVLHHIPPAKRHQVLTTVASKLAPGGRLVVFEHNPFNPLTRKAVATCPFDDDAILLWPRELKRLLAGAGFRETRQDYIVFFPRFLARLRPLEPRLRWLFLGAQTMTVAARP
jgi:2-polyprenyl-3-methyl-5-hydroxy-6-metoxy-1,4-benzoquinol methylase